MWWSIPNKNNVKKCYLKNVHCHTNEAYNRYGYWDSYFAFRLTQKPVSHLFQLESSERRSLQ